jgi:hypothetical protein
MLESLLIPVYIVKQSIVTEFIGLKEFFYNPADLPPLLPTLITLAALVVFFGILYILLFSSYSIFHLFGLRKKQYWGVVYDSVTKQPLDPALVDLRDSVGKRVASAITDMDGRYRFPNQLAGLYTLSAQKSHYTFPSKKLAGLTDDGRYSDLYFGEHLFITRDKNFIIRNIPLDPVGFDWNENEKKEHHLVYSYSRHSNLLRSTLRWYYITSLVITIAASVFVSEGYKFVVFIPIISLTVVNIIRAYFISPRPYGMVVEKKSGLALPYAQVNIFYATTSAEPIKYATKKCDSEGKYYCLMPNGRYYVIIERWVPNRAHAPILTSTQIYTSEVFTISNGILNKTFEI